MIATIDKAVIDLLDDLMTKDRDAIEGYKKASDNVNELAYKELFLRYARQRQKFVDSLKMEITSLGGVFVDQYSFASTMHRIWMDMVGTFTGKNSDFILKECLRGEEAALGDYEDALSNDLLPKSTKSMIGNHLEMLKDAIDELKNHIDAFDSKDASSTESVSHQ